jgi:alkaline phosphatase
MIDSSTKRLMPALIVVLIIGLAGSFYLYLGARDDLTQALQENSETQLQLSQLSNNYSQLSEQVQSLSDSNAELENRISELESTPPVETEVILDISGEGEVRNVILLIGDGMGPGQLTAAEIMNGNDSLALLSLPYMSMVTTYSASNYVTDSAASATALATGYKTNNQAISMSPEGENLITVVEVAETLGMSTGVVTNTRVTHATPACFMAHISNRDMEYEIAGQILETEVDVILGGGSLYFTSLNPIGAGYTIVETSEELMNLESGKILGLFTTSYMSYESERDPDIEPSLAEMTEKSIELLSSDPDGFFLMIEGGRIDHASHDNDFEGTMSEVYAFDLAVKEALMFAARRNDTLVIVTADHETGGLSITGGYSSSSIRYEWIGTGHTGSMVPVLAYGPRAEAVLGFSDNTDVGSFLLSVFE